MLRDGAHLPRDRFKIIKILILGTGFYLLFVTLFSQRIADNDLWGYLSFGRVFREDGYFPFHDIFSYTPTKPLWVYHEWLTGVIFYIIYKYSGPAGLQLLRYVVILFTIYLIYMTALKKGGKAKGLFFTRRLWVPRSSPVVLLFSIYLLSNPSLSLTAVPSFALLTPSPFFPVGAVNWIKANDIRGNILPHFDWGEYLIWTCYPACRVAMDGRYETVYKDQVSKEYFDFLKGREKWDIFLREYPHDMVLIKSKSRTHLLMLREPSWRVAYMDQWCVLFMKNENRAKKEDDKDK